MQQNNKRKLTLMDRLLGGLGVTAGVLLMSLGIVACMSMFGSTAHALSDTNGFVLFLLAKKIASLGIVAAIVVMAPGTWLTFKSAPLLFE